MSTANTLIIACGALAHELIRLKKLNDWNFELQCLPAKLHNTPALIVPAVEKCIKHHQACYPNILVAYGDCGTGGLLDKMLANYGVARLPGSHCYEFFCGGCEFEALHQANLGNFYLTDYLSRNFKRLVVEGLKLNQHPELKQMLFAHTTRLVYLAQSTDATLERQARAAAHYLELEFELRYTGLEPLAHLLQPMCGARNVPSLLSETHSQ